MVAWGALRSVSSRSRRESREPRKEKTKGILLIKI